MPLVENRKFFLKAFRLTVRSICGQGGDPARLFLRGAAAIRYTCDESEGTPSWEYYATPGATILRRWRKTHAGAVRRGLEVCDVEQIDCGLLAREGREINCSVLAEHGRDMRSFLTDETRWKN